ncbi:phage repressor protein CI [Dickeya solani]|uniref:Phage repressor protein CI n=1 Tax=Dickeya solani TaxID=1089444 RepID=A0ABU4EEL4_9GAMM|nr:phage repressor protein CI [Dickeya solani]MCA7001636.1 helix-turn-helix domain-containing protein [Dickeya solani]MDV6997012.1 phage repressor protein CI [Dickeya solani]MDV7002516.1 phage repressor protein CI [Dickeya solani]MDV7038834.1 phage repressor protein CI [Dickeya solani]MDV7042474.1 phage repressor protein CI [Dickeya solani]
MKLDESKLNNIDVLDRICEAYGFTQKMQLAYHFNIAASSLSNRYRRGAISYDFAVFCCIDTGANLNWILTGEGQKFEGHTSTEESQANRKIQKFTLSEARLKECDHLTIDTHFLSKHSLEAFAVQTEGKLHFVDKNSQLSDGLWLVDIEGAISIRELTVLPGRRLHVAGGNVPFDCGADEIGILGRVIGIYSEIN